MPRLSSFTVVLLFLLVACSHEPKPPTPTAAVQSAPLLSAAAPAAAAPSATPYALAGTEVHTLRAEGLERDYPLFVSLPRDYASTTKRYPVLFVADADYAFPLMRSIAARVGDRGAGLEDFILVGLGYADGDTPAHSRRRDYTPTANGPRNAAPDESGRAPLHGGAEAYRRFLAAQVIPFVEANYRTDPARRIFAGHSYGALFGTHVLLTEPAMFDRYILSSPSLWYDDRVMLARTRDYLRTHDDLAARLFLVIGSFETVKPGSTDRRYNRHEDMIADLRAFETLLRERRYRSLRIDTSVVPDEDHLGVYPAAITRGLRWALPPKQKIGDSR